MGFQFGGINASASSKSLKAKVVDIVAENHFNEGRPYYLFLLDQKPDPTRLLFLRKLLDTLKIESYLIVLATALSFAAKDVDETEKSNDKDERGGLLEFYEQNESNWKKYITYNGIKCEAIVCFGAAMVAITKYTKLSWLDFLATDFFPSYYYMGSCIGDINSFVYPVASLEKIFQEDRRTGVTSGDPCWITKFFIDQLRLMKLGNHIIPDLTPIQCHYVNDNMNETLDSLMNADLLALDTETNGLHHVRNRPFSIQLSINGIDSYYFDWKQIEEQKLKRKVWGVIASAKRITGANLKFDWKMLRTQGLPKTIWYTDDVVGLIHLLWSETSTSLKSSTVRFTPFTGYDYQLRVLLKQTQGKTEADYEKLPRSVTSQYAAYDSAITWRVQVQLDQIVEMIDIKYPNDKLKYWTIKKFYDQIYIPRSRMSTNVEDFGMFVDKDLMDTNREILKKKITELEEKIYKAWGIDSSFDLSSPSQLGKLFERLNWTCIERNKAGLYATNDGCLSMWKKENRPCIKELEEWRTLKVFVQTFLGQGTYDVADSGWAPLVCKINETTHKMFHNYGCMSTSTLRDRASSPNTQQLPVRGNLAKYVKQCISVPEKEIHNKWRLAHLDFQSFQARLATIDTYGTFSSKESKTLMDPVLYDIYKPDSTMNDLHCATCAAIFADAAKIQVYEVLDEHGKQWVGQEDTQIKTERGIILFKDLKTNDVILDYVD